VLVNYFSCIIDTVNLADGQYAKSVSHLFKNTYGDRRLSLSQYMLYSHCGYAKQTQSDQGLLVPVLLKLLSRVVDSDSLYLSGLQGRI